MEFVLSVDYGVSGFMLMVYELDGGVFENVGRVLEARLGC